MSRVSKPLSYTKLYGDIMRESDKAILFKIDSSPSNPDELRDRSFWFPLSQISYIYRARNGDLEEIDVADWLLDTKIRGE